MAQVKDDPPSTQADQGSLHVLQLFDFSYTVLTFDERLTVHLRTAEKANEQIQSARVQLRGLGAEVSIPKKKSMEKTISETEYHARILAQDLDPAKSESSSPQDIIKQSRLFLVLRPDNHEVCKDLESLHNACNALHNIIESCNSVRVNSIKRKPLHSPLPPSSQTSPLASPPAIKVDGVTAEQPSMSQQTEDFLAGLPPLDATKLLHHRRTSRLRNRSNSQLAQTGEAQPEQPTNDHENAFELPGWPPIPIPPPTARGYVFVPTLSTMPELEAPSEIISVTKVKPDYANDLRSPILEPGVHRVEGNDGAVNKGAANRNSQSMEPVGISSQSPNQSQPKIHDSKGLNGPNILATTMLGAPKQLEEVASPRANHLAPPRNSILEEESESETKKGASHQSSTISERPKSLVSSGRGNDSSVSALTPSTSKSSRLSEPVVAKSSSTRNRLRKAPYALANKAANVFLADSPGSTHDSIASKLASERHETQKNSTKPPPTPSNQSSQTTIRKTPSVAIETRQLPEKGLSQGSVKTIPSTTQDENQMTTYTPTLTSSPQYQTTKSFTIVSPPVSPSAEDFQKEYENAKRLSITSTTTAPPSTSHPLAMHSQSAYSTQQQINNAQRSRLLLEQNRTYSLPEMTQHRKTMSADELWIPQRAQTNPPDPSPPQAGIYSSKLAKDPRDERIISPSNVPNTSVARAPIPPYPVTPIQGPVRFSHHAPMPSLPTKLSFQPMPSSSHQPQAQDPRTQEFSVPSTTVPSTSYQGSFHFQTHQNSTPNGAGNLPATDQDQQRLFQTQPQTQSQIQPQSPPQPQLLQHAPTRSHTAPITMQQPPIQYPQSQANHQPVRFPQLQRQPPPHLQQQQQQYQQQPQCQPQPGQHHQHQQQQQQRSSTLPTATPIQAGGPPLPPKVSHSHPSTIISEGELGRERSVSGTKSTISSRSSGIGLPSPQQQPQQRHSMNFRSTTSSTLSVGVGVVADGGGGGAGAGGGSSNTSTVGAGPAVGMARKRSSWLTRQVERAGLKSF